MAYCRIHLHGSIFMHLIVDWCNCFSLENQTLQCYNCLVSISNSVKLRRQDGPLNLFSHFQGRDCIATKLVRQWNFPWLLFQRHRFGVPRESIMIRSIETGEGLEPIQMTSLLKDLGV